MRPRTRVLLLTGALLLAPLAGSATPAAAATPDRYGFAYLDNPAPPAGYVPDLSRQFSGGPPVTVSPTGPVGMYQVRFPGQAAPGGVAHVTAVNRTGEWCMVQDYLPVGADEVVNVRCYRPGGAPANSRFTVLFSRSSGVVPPAAGSYASLRSSPGGAVMATYNSLGPANTVLLGGVGSYQATLPAVGAGGSLTGGLQVTATNGATPARCKVAGWTTTGAGQTVQIRCVNPAGAPAYAGWTLSWQGKRAINGGLAPPSRFGYLFDTLGVPPPATVHNSLGGAAVAGAAGVGLRTVNFSLIGLQQDHMQVTAVGSGPEYCTMAQPWTTSGGTVTLRYVICYTNAGALITQPSLVTYMSRG